MAITGPGLDSLHDHVLNPTDKPEVKVIPKRKPVVREVPSDKPTPPPVTFGPKIFELPHDPTVTFMSIPQPDIVMSPPMTPLPDPEPDLEPEPPIPLENLLKEKCPQAMVFLDEEYKTDPLYPLLFSEDNKQRMVRYLTTKQNWYQEFIFMLSYLLNKLVKQHGQKLYTSKLKMLILTSP